MDGAARPWFCFPADAIRQRPAPNADAGRLRAAQTAAAGRERAARPLSAGETQMRDDSRARAITIINAVRAWKVSAR